uniref:Magnesium transporter NIPA2 n=1 Tax=Arion vulgaris TaxID=1028688 RepID=A0A0B7ACE6_9EUPU
MDITANMSTNFTLDLSHENVTRDYMTTTTITTNISSSSSLYDETSRLFTNSSVISTERTLLNDTNGTTVNLLMASLDKDVQDFVIGLVLALSSSLFIGSSFILKKLGLLRYAKKVSVRAGDGGFGYLKEWMWWAGMILMTVGEFANFAAYAFAPATLVTPLGALSVIVSAVLASHVLKERLNILGKVGCVLCVLGSTVMVIHSPKEQEVHDLNELMNKMKEPAFIVYSIIIVVIAIVMIIYFAPRYGQKNVLVYVTICSTLGSLTVMGCKGVGTAIKATARGHNEFTNWLTYLLLAIVIICILLQLNYLNKALDTFNTAVVTPIYYVFFTSCVILGSVILFQEFMRTDTFDIIGDLCGFLTIIVGIFLLNAFKDMKISWRNLPSASKGAETTEEAGSSINVANGVTNTNYMVDCRDIEAHIQRNMSLDGSMRNIANVSDVDKTHITDKYHANVSVQGL